jgi:hypothetical protein
MRLLLATPACSLVLILLVGLHSDDEVVMPKESTDNPVAAAPAGVM